MSEPSKQGPRDLFGSLPPLPPPKGARAAEIVGGIVLILAGVALALPGGLCTSLMIPVMLDGSPGRDTFGIGIIAAVIALSGGCLIWWGCRLVLKDGPVGGLFAAIVAGLIVVMFLLVMSLATSLSNDAN